MKKAKYLSTNKILFKGSKIIISIKKDEKEVLNVLENETEFVVIAGKKTDTFFGTENKTNFQTAFLIEHKLKEELDDILYYSICVKEKVVIEKLTKKTATYFVDPDQFTYEEVEEALGKEKIDKILDIAGDYSIHALEMYDFDFLTFFSYISSPDNFDLYFYETPVGILVETLKELKQMIDSTKNAISEEKEIKEKIKPFLKIDNMNKTINRNLKKLKTNTKSSQAYSEIINWFDELTELPLKQKKESNKTITELNEILDSTHYGLKKVKERIIESIITRRLGGKTNEILLFDGAPGTAKTTIAKTIAEALGREYVKVSLGGISDETEIRGHRRTYLGAVPGKIIKAMQQCETNNPVILLDEIDKLGKGKGDPAAALLEVLDPTQNNEFVDSFIEVPYDLSNVIFICTSNDHWNIARPLKDRMELISFKNYTQKEKYKILKEYLIPKALNELNLPIKISISQKVTTFLIDNYTFEAGVRQLNKRIKKILRKLAVKYYNGELKENENYTITTKRIEEILEIKKRQKLNLEPKIGIINGLAVTGGLKGSVLAVQAKKAPFTTKEKIEATGNLKDVMKESILVAHNFLKTWEKTGSLFKETGFYMHFPAGGTPKDGPSAGITITTALLSAILKKPVCGKVGMTGEINIFGDIMAIGGLKEKIEGGYEEGLRTFFISEENREDLKKVEPEILKELTIHVVSNYEEVYSLLFDKKKDGDYIEKIAECC